MPPSSPHDFDKVIYKVCSLSVWTSVRSLNEWVGSPDDQRDGFIHFSTGPQLHGTVKKHFAGQADLMILSIDVTQLGERLRWEPSRGGDLFPHLYGPLPISAIVGAEPLVAN